MRQPKSIQSKGSDLRGQVIVRKGAEIHESDGAPWRTAEDTPAYVLGEVDARWMRVSLHGTRTARGGSFPCSLGRKRCRKGFTLALR